MDLSKKDVDSNYLRIHSNRNENHSQGPRDPIDRVHHFFPFASSILSQNLIACFVSFLCYSIKMASQASFLAGFSLRVL